MELDILLNLVYKLAYLVDIMVYRKFDHQYSVKNLFAFKNFNLNKGEIIEKLRPILVFFLFY